MKQIAIIGAGASGMAAALEAARDPQNNVLLFERQSRVGRKLLATGNGRCNLSNLAAQHSKYHGDDINFVTPALKSFDVENTLNFFKSLGLLTRVEDGGRIYPCSNHAASVVDVLRFGLEQAGVKLYCGLQVTDVKSKSGAFSVTANQESFTADTVIIACGGLAGAHLGASSDGYELLESFGHKRTKLFPSLVQIKTDPLYPRALKGVKVYADVSVVSGGGVDAQARGELLFTEYGVSGPAIFDVSRAATTSRRGQKLHIDLLPDYCIDKVFMHLNSRRRLSADLRAERILTGSLQNRLALTLFKASGIAGEKKLSAITENELWALAKLIKCFKLKVFGTMGFENAQITAGGIRTSEFDPSTMQSRLVPQLFACGEVLDIDGDCGGLNLQWAWSSGRLAGRAGKKHAAAGTW